MTTDEHGRSIIETTFEYDGRTYEAVGYGVIESGPGVYGRLMIEDLRILHWDTVRQMPAMERWLPPMWDAAHDALAAQYWREAKAERE